MLQKKGVNIKGTGEVLRNLMKMKDDFFKNVYPIKI
jgi:hypothetical protein